MRSRGCATWRPSRSPRVTEEERIRSRAPTCAPQPPAPPFYEHENWITDLLWLNGVVSSRGLDGSGEWLEADQPLRRGGGLPSATGVPVGLYLSNSPAAAELEETARVCCARRHSGFGCGNVTVCEPQEGGGVRTSGVSVSVSVSVSVQVHASLCSPVSFVTPGRR